MIRVIELFSGIGSQHAALERLGIPYKIVGMAEIDKYAIKSYEAIHGATHNYGDISKIDRLGKADFWTYSFPCQDISVAGKQRGINEGTRSGLLYEVERLLEVAKEHDELPTCLMLENVKNLVGKKFKPDFDKWIGKLNELGYNTYWKVLNAKHYGVPQNRERVFAISIKKEFDMGYMFPEGFDNGLRLKDILEEEVDEKFYITNEKSEKLLNSNFHQERDRIQTKDHCDTLLARDYKDPKVVLIPQATTKGYIECSVPGVFDMTYPDSKTRRGRVQDHGEIVPTLTAASQDIMYVEPKPEFGRMGRQAVETFNKNNCDFADTINPFNMIVDRSGASPTLTTRPEGFKTAILPITHNYRIRKLTPKECFRLMGFTDEEFYKAAYKKEQITFKGGNKWNVKLMDATDNQTPENMETFALNITNDFPEQVGTSTEWKKHLKTPEKEKKQNVNVVIDKLAELGHSDIATNIIKCTESMKTLITLTEGSVPLHTVIIELDETVRTNTARYMRITSGEPLNLLKLSTILTLIEQIIESKISISTLQQVSIQGYIVNIEDLQNDTDRALILSLKTEGTFTRVSSSQLYKQAGNSIVVDVLYHLFKNLFVNQEEGTMQISLF